jgi:hypothetical protein
MRKLMDSDKSSDRSHYGAYKQSDGLWSGVKTFTSYNIAKNQLQFFAHGRGYIINAGETRYDK